MARHQSPHRVQQDSVGASDQAMAGPLEEKSFSDLSGAKIVLQHRSYSDFCREFSISCPKVSLWGIMTCTCGVWVLAYGLFVLSENTMVLSSAIFVTLIGMLFYLHCMKIDQETLLVIGSLGVQLTSTYASGKESTTFIEMRKVKDIVINEAIYTQKVIYYLCILLRDPLEPGGVSEVVPVFQSAKPRLECLIEVYRSCQEILEERKTL